MRSKISIAGHPLHPILVTVPVGLLLWALVADIVYYGSGRTHEWYSISFWSGIAAIVSALVAALPGFGDLLTMAIHTGARNMALMHMVINLIVVALYFAAMLMMLSDGAFGNSRYAAVIILHAIGSGLILLSGWLGGEMVYRHHLSVIPDADLEEAEHRHHELRPHARPQG